jgi:hypothetical protein
MLTNASLGPCNCARDLNVWRAQSQGRQGPSPDADAAPAVANTAAPTAAGDPALAAPAPAAEPAAEETAADGEADAEPAKAAKKLTVEVPGGMPAPGNLRPDPLTLSTFSYIFKQQLQFHPLVIQMRRSRSHMTRCRLMLCVACQAVPARSSS